MDPHPPTDPLLALETREGLPDALRVLLAEWPREGWEGHPNFAGLVAMWLDRHLLFRRLVGTLRADAESALDARLDPGAWGPRLARLGGHFLNDLHGHHQIEDHHYFPLLARRDARLLGGFDLLDADHHALHDHLDAFAAQANAALAPLAQGGDWRDPAGRLHEGLVRLERFLDRHLTDEEDLIVPVLLRDGQAAVG